MDLSNHIMFLPFLILQQNEINNNFFHWERARGSTRATCSFCRHSIFVLIMSKHVLPGTTRFCCLPDGVIRVPEMATVHFRMSLIRSYFRRRIARMKSHLLRYSKLIRHSLKGLIATSLRTLNAALLAIRDKNMKIKLQHSWWVFFILSILSLYSWRDKAYSKYNT